MASISACRLLPRPEINTPIRRFVKTEEKLGSGVIYRGHVRRVSVTAFRLRRENRMPRRRRTPAAGLIFHIVNRGAKRAAVLEEDDGVRRLRTSPRGGDHTQER